ncbi:MAG TPA: transketolase C-terminal domain-containing protein, partial [Gemmatimonadales bacterium]|nr:transketolase C-terminal domain-containing protein [Gemmatimonadales bacterium]
ESVRRTGRLLAVDGDWSSCGVAAEVIAAVVEAVEPARLRARPVRVTLPDAPAPTSAPLERIYYPTVDDVVGRALTMVGHFEEAE